MTPTEFVRSMPDGAKPKEILAEAEKMGFKINLGQIYRVHSLDRKKTKKPKGGIKPGSRKARLLEFCTSYIEEHARGPRMPLIIAATKMSQGGVSSTLKILKEEGRLDWEPGNYESMWLPKTAAKPRKQSNGIIVHQKAITVDDVLKMEHELTTKYQTEMAGLALIKKLFGP